MAISESPLIPHIERLTPGVQEWLENLNTWPAGILSFEVGVCQWVKRTQPEVTTFYRRVIPDEQQGSYLSEGEVGGRRFVREVPDLFGVDYFIGVNEPTGEEPVSVQQANAFYVGFAQECRARGVRPLGPNIATGNPDDSTVAILAPCVQAILNAGGLVTYHSYGPANLWTDDEYLIRRAVEHWRPRLVAAGVSGPIPLAYTEAGWDDVGPQPSGPWRDLVRDGHLTIPGMKQQLGDYAAQCHIDFVRYAALFTFGASARWARYDYMVSSELRDWLAWHWAAFAPPEPPGPGFPRSVLVTPGPKFASAYLRRSPVLEDSFTTVRRDERIVIEGEVDEFYRVSCYIPKWLVREMSADSGLGE